jgi:hypothetical protein
MTINVTARARCLPLGRAERRRARGLQAAAPTSGGPIYFGYTSYREKWAIQSIGSALRYPVILVMTPMKSHDGGKYKCEANCR